MKKLILCALLFSVGCGGDPGPAMGDGDGGGAPVCERDRIEPDLLSPETLPPGLFGPGVDPATGALMAPGPEGYIVTTTYLRLRPEPAVQARFGELVGPMVPALMGNAGLVAMQLVTSADCGTARTLTVWRDEASMMAFVGSPEHTAAIGSIGEVSRGGSVTLHWTTGDAASVGWTDAAARLASHTGPVY